MIDLSTLKAEVKLMPHRWIVYGAAGAGKSTLASQAPNPIFLCTEDGANALLVVKPRIKTYDEIMGYLRALWKQNHDYKTVVIDTLDALDVILSAHVVEEYNNSSSKKINTLSEIDYGKGVDKLLIKWRTITDALNCLRDDKGMNIILLAHNAFEGKIMQDPINGSYTKHDLKLHSKCSAHLVEWADCVFYACGKLQSVGDNKKGKIMREIDKILYTEDDGGCRAKNRYDLPEKITFEKDGGYQLIDTMIKDYINKCNSNVVTFNKSTETKERNVAAYLSAG